MEDVDASTIECGEEGVYKWSGIAAANDKLFCTPFHSSKVLVIDAATEAVHTIECGEEGNYKWSGIAAANGKLFCAPFKSSKVLVIDAATEAVHTIECGEGGYNKWNGIAAANGKLFCAPCCSSKVLVIDAATEAVHTIECGEEGDFKWNGIAAANGKLFCAPCCSSKVLVIDAATEAVHTIECGEGGNYKWRGIAAANGKLFCAPCGSQRVLTLRPADKLERLESDTARPGAHGVVQGLGKLLGSGKCTDVVFRVGSGSGSECSTEDIAAHRAVLVARPAVSEAMLAERWGTSEAGALPGSAAPAAEARCVVPVADTEPAAFRQLLRYVYTGQCEPGALAAMPAHLLDVSAKHGIQQLQELSAQAMVLSLAAENVCDFFAQAHAHEHEELKDACVELMDKQMMAVSQPEGFKRLGAERPQLALEMYKHMALVRSPEGQSRKRKRSEACAST
eukprot:g6177.t1